MTLANWTFVSLGLEFAGEPPRHTFLSVKGLLILHLIPKDFFGRSLKGVSFLLRLTPHLCRLTNTIW